MREGKAIGALLVSRFEYGTFDQSAVELVQAFAEQAVIALSSAAALRALRDRTAELQEALEQQTASAEILQVINKNPGNLAPVFGAVLEKAHTLCGAAIGSLALYDGTNCRAVATQGYPEEYAKVVQQPQPPSARIRRLISGADFIHVLDMKAEEVDSAHAVDRSRSLLTGTRTALFVPLRKDRTLLGFISAYRLHVREF